VTDRVLVTGISGFLGGHVALQLLQRGYRVRGSVRDLARAGQIRATMARHGADTGRLEIVRLELTSDVGWPEAMADVRYLQHVASPLVIDQPRDRNELIRPAVEGTRRALAAALAAGVERIVLTSSIAAIVYGHADYGRTFTTADWSVPESRRADAYPESKLRAEREAWAIAEARGARDRLAVINPAAILGPLLDPDPGTSGELLLRLLSGAVPLAPRLSFSLVDVRDVAEAHVMAMTSPEAGGHRHILSEREMSILELAEVLRRHFPELAHRLPRREAPDWLVRLAGLFDRRIGDYAGELGNHRRVDGSSGARLLGHPLISAPDAALATAQSLLEHGLIDRK
jgi:dihydroflavonol-4-reductase